VVSVIAADVRAAVELGVVRGFDPQVVAEFIVGGIEKIVIRALDEGRAIDVARITREIAVLVSSGLVPGEHSPPLPAWHPGRPAASEPGVSDTEPLGVPSPEGSALCPCRGGSPCALASPSSGSRG